MRSTNTLRLRMSDREHVGDWIGQPLEAPDLVVQHAEAGGSQVFLSWNG